jgi:hypothetical protein
MGDSFTNLLLITLITLLGYIGKVFYDKMEDVLKRIEQILLSDVGQKKDIENLKEDLEDHEIRITSLEKSKQ